MHSSVHVSTDQSTPGHYYRPAMFVSSVCIQACMRTAASDVKLVLTYAL